MFYVSDMTLYSIRSGIFSQWSFLRTGVMWWCFVVLVTEGKVLELTLEFIVKVCVGTCIFVRL